MNFHECGNWFQTNQPEREWNDCAGRATSVFVTNEKDMVLQ